MNKKQAIRWAERVVHTFVVAKRDDDLYDIDLMFSTMDTVGDLWRDGLPIKKKIALLTVLSTGVFTDEGFYHPSFEDCLKNFNEIERRYKKCLPIYLEADVLIRSNYYCCGERYHETHEITRWSVFTGKISSHIKEYDYEG